MKKISKITVLLLSFAIIFAFVPLSAEVAYADGDFYFNESSVTIYYHSGDTTVELKGEDIYNTTGKTVSYQWLDGNNNPISGQTGKTYTVPATEGSYSLKATVGSGSDELTVYKYFNIYHELQDIKVTLEYVPVSGITQIPEYDYYYGNWATENGTEYFKYDDYLFPETYMNEGDKVLAKDSGGKIRETFVLTKIADGNNYYFEWRSDNKEAYLSDSSINWADVQSSAKPFVKGNTYKYSVNFSISGNTKDGDWYTSDETIINFDIKIVDNPDLTIQNGIYYYINSGDDSAEIRYSDQNLSGAVNIPAAITINGTSRSVEDIDSESFMNRKGITSVTIPESVRYIGDNAFTNTGLTSVTIPSSVYSLNGRPFGFNISYDKDGKEIATPVEGFKVYAREESAAGQWAKRKGLTVVDQEGDKTAKELEKTRNELDTLKAKAKTVKNFKAKAQKKGKALLTWKKTAGVNGYQIFRSMKKSSGFKSIKLIKNAKTVKFTDSKLKKGKTYYYKIRTYTNVAGKKKYGKWSSVVKVKAK